MSIHNEPMHMNVESNDCIARASPPILMRLTHMTRAAAMKCTENLLNKEPDIQLPYKNYMIKQKLCRESDESAVILFTCALSGGQKNATNENLARLFWSALINGREVFTKVILSNQRQAVLTTLSTSVKHVHSMIFVA